MSAGAGAKAEVLERVAALCHRLPAKVVDSICEKLEQAVGPGGGGMHTDLTGIPDSSVRAEIGDVLEKWLAADSQNTIREFAQVLRGAAAAERAARGRQGLELVWTGPSPPNSSLRRTEQALLEVIKAAKKDLWIVSFASYKVPAISSELLEAAKRGVQIRLVLESKEESDGKVTFSALKGLGSQLAERAAVYVWPNDRRPTNEAGGQGALHAKCALADQKILFVSSANLTEYAMTLNMEMGVLIRGSALPRRTADHLNWLVTNGILRSTSGS